ncbi:MAG TPA: hypothetical protein VF519_02795 [Mycobacteriales bacterium]|jgi:hypothetical protein
MAGERLGPLSYDVTAPTGEVSAQRAVVLGGATIVALMALSLFGGWIVLGIVAEASVVVLGAPLLIVGGAVAVALYASRDSVRRTKRNALLAVGALALLSALFTNRILDDVKPALPQIRKAVDDVRLPPGYRLVDEKPFGDRLCRRGCPGFERLYETPAADKDPVATMILAMFDQGWEPGTDGDPKLATVAVRGTLMAHLSPLDGGGVEMRVSRR